MEAGGQSKLLAVGEQMQQPEVSLLGWQGESRGGGRGQWAVTATEQSKVGTEFSSTVYWGREVRADSLAARHLHLCLMCAGLEEEAGVFVRVCVHMHTCSCPIPHFSQP